MARAVAEYANLTYPHRSLKALQKLRDKAESGARAITSTSRTAYRIDRRLGSERVANIIAAYKAGATASSIATDHGVSQTALVQLLRDAGVPIRRQALTEDQVAQIVDLYEQGASTYEIERATGIPKSTVGRALNHTGVQMRPRGGSRPRKATYR
jgi:hypothetical protein